MKNKKSNNPCHTEGNARSILRKQSRDISVSTKPQYDKEMDCHDLTSKSHNDSVAKAIESHNDKSTKHYKNFAVFFVGSLGVACVISALLGILLYLYDPFMFFHKPYFRATTYHSDLRIAARGIIDYADFDSVILGSSMIENTSAKEAGRKLGGKWVNISLAGSDFSERKVALKYAFRRKDIKQVIFSLDGYVLLNGDRESVNARIDSTLYAEGDFDGLSWDKFKQYLDKKLIWCAIKWSKKGECVGDKKDLESVAHSEYRRNERHFRGFAFWGEWQKNEVTKQYSAYLANDLRPQSKQTKRLDFEAQKAYLQEGILEMIRENPQIRFSLIYPPYPRFFYALFPLDDVYHKGRNSKEMLAETEKILKWLVAEIKNLDNAKIYGFDDLPYADDITNYCDRTHYYIDMNSLQLDAIANGTHILTPQNIDAYLQTMESKIKNYDIAPLIAEIKAWEASQK